MIHNRIVTGDTSPIYVLATASVAIHPGDIVYLASSAALPVSSASWSTDLPGTQKAVQGVNLGVALDYHRASDGSTTHQIQVATRGRYKVATVDSQARDVGTLFGPAKAAGNALLANSVDVVATAPLALGRLTHAKLATDTTVELEIFGTLTTGGVQAIAS